MEKRDPIVTKGWRPRRPSGGREPQVAFLTTLGLGPYIHHWLQIKRFQLEAHILHSRHEKIGDIVHPAGRSNPQMSSITYSS